MNQTRAVLSIFSLLTLGGATFSLYGCGGGGSGASGGAGSVDSLASGRAALNSMASGTQTTTTQSLTNALALFQQALKSDPNNPIARFGEAVAMAGVCTDLMDGGTTTVPPPSSGSGTGGVTGAGSGIGAPMIPAFSKAAKSPVATRDGGGPGTVIVGPNIPASPSSGQLPPAPPDVTGTPAPSQPSNTLGLIWFLDRGLSSPYTLLQELGPVTDLHLGLMPFSGYASDSTDVAKRQALLTQLGTILSDLAVVEADPTFTYTLPSPDQNGQTVTLGLPEVYMFDAYINSLQTEIALSLAYVRDPGNYQPLPPVIVANSGGATGTNDYPPAPPVFVGPAVNSGPITLSYTSLDTNHDGKLEPSEYLPPSPFLTLRSASYLTTAQTSLAATAAKETLGIKGVLARASGGSFLIPNTTAIATILNNIQTNVVPLIAQAATGPVTLTFPHYGVTSLVGAIAEGADGAGGVFQSVPVLAVTVDTPPAPPTTGGSGSGSSAGGTVTVPPYISFTEQKVTIDIAAWFNNPPADLKAFAPTYTLTAQGGINPGGAVYPDPTFGGLFPNGLPTNLLL